MGAAGIMFPYVSSVETAKRAVNAMKYPPMGSRGVAGAIRATRFATDWPQYFAEANERSLVVVQIETPEAVDAAEQIAAVDGVDVLFVERSISRAELEPVLDEARRNLIA